MDCGSLVKYENIYVQPGSKLSGIGWLAECWSQGQNYGTNEADRRVLSKMCKMPEIGSCVQRLSNVGYLLSEMKEVVLNGTLKYPIGGRESMIRDLSGNSWEYFDFGTYDNGNNLHLRRKYNIIIYSIVSP